MTDKEIKSLFEKNFKAQEKLLGTLNNFVDLIKDVDRDDSERLTNISYVCEGLLQSAILANGTLKTISEGLFNLVDIVNKNEEDNRSR